MKASEFVIENKIFPKHKTLRKILVVRLQATGDVVIALPYLKDFREKLPENVTLDLLTREETELIPKSIHLFNTVFALKGGRNTKLQFLFFLLLLPKLLLNRYDIILDLQNNRLTKYIRLLLMIKSYALFDKFSEHSAGDRYKQTINSLDIAQVEFRILNPFSRSEIQNTLSKFKLHEIKNYVVLNPAGAFKNRNWNIENYIELATIWNKTIDSDTKFVVLGLNKIKEKTSQLKSRLNLALHDFVGETTLLEAAHILKSAKLIISEDSGLMHLAYSLGLPTIGILGSTRADWTDPKLPHTHFFVSSDLECGNCMLSECKYEDIKCLTRLKANQVIAASQELLRKTSM